MFFRGLNRDTNCRRRDARFTAVVRRCLRFPDACVGKCGRRADGGSWYDGTSGHERFPDDVDLFPRSAKSSQRFDGKSA